jgi:hypothetical protein
VTYFQKEKNLRQSIDLTMTLSSDKLLDEEINAILITSVKNKRQCQRSLMPIFETRIWKVSETQLAVRLEIGVHKLEWEILITECRIMITNFNLFVHDESVSALSVIENDTENISQLALDDEEL